MSPFNAWVLSKSLETLSIRVEKHCENALKVAIFLEEHPKVNLVKYPFLKSHPQYEIAKKQMKLGGNIVAFEIKGGIDSWKKFFKRYKNVFIISKFRRYKNNSYASSINNS